MKKIGIVSPFNPFEIKDFLYQQNDKVLNNNVSATSVHALVIGLIKLGYRVIVFTYDLSIGEDVVYYGENVSVYVCSIYSFSLKYYKLGFFSRAYMGGVLSKKISKHVDEISVLYAQWTYDYAKACVPYVNTVPVFCTIRDWCPYICSMQRDVRSKVYWLISYCVFNKVIRNKKIKFIANSFYTKRKFEELIGVCIPVIFNPIKGDYLLNKRTSYPSTHIFVSIAVNLFEERKNIKSLLIAFQLYLKDFPDSKLQLIGGYDEDRMEAYRNRGLLKNVMLLGRLQHDDIATILDRSSALIHPSLEETFGNILLEGMARRLPVIGGDNSGAVPFVLGNGKYGCLCDVCSPKSLYYAMRKVMEDSNYRISLIRESYRYLVDNYLDITIAQKYIDLYNVSMGKR